MTFASIVCIIIARGVAACAPLLFLEEIVAAREHRLLCRGMTAFCGLATIVACLSVSVSCSPQRALSTGDDASCHNAVSQSRISSRSPVLTVPAGRTMECRYRAVHAANDCERGVTDHLLLGHPDHESQEVEYYSMVQWSSAGVRASSRITAALKELILMQRLRASEPDHLAIHDVHLRQPSGHGSSRLLGFARCLTVLEHNLPDNSLPTTNSSQLRNGRCEGDNGKQLADPKLRTREQSPEPSQQYWALLAVQEVGNG